MNVVCVSGNLCADPEKRVTQNGISQVSCRIAVQREYKDASTGKREADFINIVAWRQQADFLSKYASKGDKITVKGVIQTHSYEKDGQKKFVTEINADRVELDKARPRPEYAQYAPEGEADTFTEVDDSDIPF